MVPLHGIMLHEFTLQFNAKQFYFAVENKAPELIPWAGNIKVAFPIGVCQYDPDTLNHCEGLKMEMPLRSNIGNI